MDDTEQKCVYVVGAGFSKALGYPLTSELLLQLWNRIEEDLKFKEELGRIIRFHHPRFNCCKSGSFPNVEHLLSEMVVNEELYASSRRYSGKFTKDDLQRLKQTLLMKIADWFHILSREINLSEPSIPWLNEFHDRVRREKAVIISFNWDLILDQLLFGINLDGTSYGFCKESPEGPILLKPHGSLNWFESDPGRYIEDSESFRLFEKKNRPRATVFAFRKFRAPETKHDRKYTPLIIPPVYMKKFAQPIFRELWQKCTSWLSAANKVFFLGYSLPEADYHARFILRCGFHNQTEGELDKRNRRKNPTGPAEVIIVNPDCEAARRIKESVSPEHKCWWFPTPIEDPDLRWDLPSLSLHPDHSRKRCDKPADPPQLAT